MTLKVLIADDHAIVRKGLRDILREASEEALVGEASNGQEVLDLVRAEPWDVVVLDISMPGANGIAVLKKLKAMKPDLPVLMLSMHADAKYVLGSLSGGASGYLSKESAPDELLAALHGVQGRQRYVSRIIVEALGLDL
jgi:DNA-binding NarL/FixJ family response regulator